MRADRTPQWPLATFWALLITLPVLAAAPETIVDLARISVSTDGAQALGGRSLQPATSADGRHTAFSSEADNIVPGDENESPDVFVHDAETGEVVCVSLNLEGETANGDSDDPDISADGRFVAFASTANDLIEGDTGGKDIFVHDRDFDGDTLFDEPGATATVRVSVNSEGDPGPMPSFQPAISANGRYVAFASFSTLVFNDTNNEADIFRHDRDTEGDGVFDEPGSTNTIRVSTPVTAAQANDQSTMTAISGDGDVVAFMSGATNLVSGDTNRQQDIFVRHVSRTTTERVSIGPRGAQADWGCFDPDLNHDGSLVVFSSAAMALDPLPGHHPAQMHCYLRNRRLGLTERVSLNSRNVPGNGQSVYPSISADGQFISFGSLATNMATGDTNRHPDIFVRDRNARRTERAAPAQGQPNGPSQISSLSPDGETLVFASEASNFVPGDTNGVADIFVASVEPGGGSGGMLPPVANAGKDRSVRVPHDRDLETTTARITLDGSRSRDPERRPLTFAWSDRTGKFTSTSRRFTVDLEPGDYVFTLAVTDATGKSDSDSVNVSVFPEENRGPVANAGRDRVERLRRGTTVRIKLDGRKSKDPDRDRLTFRWNHPTLGLLGHGSLLPVNLPLGDHRITLTVRDPYGADATDSLEIRVQTR